MTSLQRSIRDSWVFAAIAAIAILGVGFGITAYISNTVDTNRQDAATRKLTQDNSDNLHCIESWANALTARSAFIQKYLQPRNNTFATLELARINKVPEKEMDRLRAAYIKADQEYRRATRDNPIPPPPKLLCARAAHNLTDPPSGTAPGGASPTPKLTPTGPATTSGVPRRGIAGSRPPGNASTDSTTTVTLTRGRNGAAPRPSTTVTHSRTVTATPTTEEPLVELTLPVLPTLCLRPLLCLN